MAVEKHYQHVSKEENFGSGCSNLTNKGPRPKDEGPHSQSLSVSKSSRPDSRRQKRPDFRQHLLNRWPLPHGHRSLRPSFSTSNLSPWTIRTPALTFVSDGYPRRRLLISSKKLFVVDFAAHGTPPFGMWEADTGELDEVRWLFPVMSWNYCQSTCWADHAESLS